MSSSAWRSTPRPNTSMKYMNYFTFVYMLNAICITTNQLEHIQTNLCIYLSYLEDQRNLKIYNKKMNKENEIKEDRITICIDMIRTLDEKHILHFSYSLIQATVVWPQYISICSPMGGQYTSSC